MDILKERHHILAAQLINGQESGTSKLNFISRIYLPILKHGYRRLARGAFLSARLLQEGVLDADKRLRNLFRTTLKPLLALQSVSAVEMLHTVRHPNSRTWLIGFLLDTLREENVTENVAGTAALCLLLDENLDRDQIALLQDHLRRAPTANQAAVIRLVEYTYHGMRRSDDEIPKFPEWLARFALSILTTSGWSERSANELNALLSVAHFLYSAQQNKAERARRSDEWYLTRSLFRWNRQGIFGAKQRESIGPLSVEHLKGDWTRGREESADRFAKRISKVKSSAGIFELLRLTSAFTVDRSRNSFLELLRYIDAHGFHTWDLLPQILKSLVPSFDSIDHVRQLRKAADHASDDEFAEAISNRNLQGIALVRAEAGLMARSKLNSTMDEHLADRYAYVLPHFIYGDAVLISGEMRRGDARKQFKDRCLDIIFSKPECVVSSSWCWPALVQDLHDRGNEFRRKLTALCRVRSEPNRDYGHMFTQQSMFSLKMPEESPLLPWIVLAVATDAFTPRPVKNERIPTSSIVEQFVPDSRLLVQTIDSSADLPIRVAASLLLLLHPTNGNEFLPNVEASLLEGIRCGLGNWFTVTFGYVVRTKSSESDTKWRSFMNCAIEVSHGNYEFCEVIDSVLERWRETSHMPVENAGVLETWLPGT